MTKANDSDRYVVPNPDGGWDVVKGSHRRASAHTQKKAEAINRAREIVSNLGGGEVRIQNMDGPSAIRTRRVGETSRRRKTGGDRHGIGGAYDTCLD